MLKQVLTRCAYWVNDTFPGVKSMIPKSLHRFVLLKVVGVNKGYEHMLRTNPERLFLEKEALPWVARSYRKVLFVGTASYTYHYERIFADDPSRYSTIDRMPLNRVWGADSHIVDSIENIDRHRPEGFFDAIVLSGVLAYRIPQHNEFGLIEEHELRPLLAALHRVIRPGGLLLVGWNQKDMPQSLHQRGLLEPLFKPFDQTPWGARKDFQGDSHAFEFYQRL